MTSNDTTNSHFMQECLALASQANNCVASNPLVGSVITYNNKIISSGYHQVYGEAHAERNAILNLKDHSLLENSCIYVNLEPCSHFGKTPPCADLIIEKKIPKVVVACRDINPKVSGQGLTRLREAGIEVIENVLEKKAIHLNRRFFTFHELGRPYVILKWAETSDGFIARSDYSSKWISCEESRQLSHLWRAQESAIMVGKSTAQHDNPRLNVRLNDSTVKFKQPLRIVTDRNLTLSPALNIFDGSQDTLIFNEKDSRTEGQLSYAKLNDEGENIHEILNYLYQRKVLSVMIEGGAKLHQSFIKAGIWDEARVFCSPEKFGSGIAAAKLERKCNTQTKVGRDTLKIFINNKFYDEEE